MKANWFHVLVALAEGELHGLGIARSVLDQTGGKLRLWPATLYSALESMAETGLIRELEADELDSTVSAQRRYYQLTDDGRRALGEEARRLAALASVALERLGPS